MWCFFFLFFGWGEGERVWDWWEVGRCWIGHSDFFFFFTKFLETFHFFIRLVGMNFLYYIPNSYVEYDIYLTYTTSRTSEISEFFFSFFFFFLILFYFFFSHNILFSGFYVTQIIAID